MNVHERVGWSAARPFGRRQYDPNQPRKSRRAERIAAELTRFVSRSIFDATQLFGATQEARRSTPGMVIESDVFFISVAARRLGMHPQTLRKYERLGLVQPETESPTST